MANVYYNFNGKRRKAKQNSLLGEIVQLFDTKGQDIREKEADAKLKALELAQAQLNQPAPAVPTWAIVLIIVSVVVVIGLVVWRLTKKKQ